MTIATTEPGIRIHDGRRAIRPGHPPCEGRAIAAQYRGPILARRTEPPGFPGIEPAPDQTGERITEWRFAKT